MVQFVNTVANRLFSLDVFRGLIMFLPIGEAAVSMKALPNLPKLPRAMERPYKDGTNLGTASVFGTLCSPFPMEALLTHLCLCAFTQYLDKRRIYVNPIIEIYT
jgi:hypothetical protein